MKPGSMAWETYRAGIHGTSYTSPATIIAVLLLYHSFVSCFSELSRPILEHRALPASKVRSIIYPLLIQLPTQLL
jgi:hypothetical protein